MPLELAVRPGSAARYRGRSPQPGLPSAFFGLRECGKGKAYWFESEALSDRPPPPRSVDRSLSLRGPDPVAITTPSFQRSNTRTTVVQLVDAMTSVTRATQQRLGNSQTNDSHRRRPSLRRRGSRRLVTPGSVATLGSSPTRMLGVLIAKLPGRYLSRFDSCGSFRPTDPPRSFAIVRQSRTSSSPSFATTRASSCSHARLDACARSSHVVATRRLHAQVALP